MTETAVPARAPHTYQEWLDCLAHVLAYPRDRACLLRMRQGSFSENQPYILERFLQQLDEAVRQALSRFFDDFLRQIDDCFETGDFDGVEMLSARLHGDVAAWFFFSELPGIPPMQRAELTEGYTAQIARFWQRFLSALRADAEESGSGALEDLAVSLTRLGRVWTGGGGEGHE